MIPVAAAGVWVRRSVEQHAQAVDLTACAQTHTRYVRSRNARKEVSDREERKHKRGMTVEQESGWGWGYPRPRTAPRSLPAAEFGGEGLVSSEQQSASGKERWQSGPCSRYRPLRQLRARAEPTRPLPPVQRAPAPCLLSGSQREHRRCFPPKESNPASAPACKLGLAGRSK
eukprot:2924327-Rhodomonas_salina.1